MIFGGPQNICPAADRTVSGAPPYAVNTTDGYRRDDRETVGETEAIEELRIYSPTAPGLQWALGMPEDVLRDLGMMGHRPTGPTAGCCCMPSSFYSHAKQMMSLWTGEGFNLLPKSMTGPRYSSSSASSLATV